MLSDPEAHGNGAYRVTPRPKTGKDIKLDDARSKSEKKASLFPLYSLLHGQIEGAIQLILKIHDDICHLTSWTDEKKCGWWASKWRYMESRQDRGVKNRRSELQAVHFLCLHFHQKDRRGRSVKTRVHFKLRKRLRHLHW